MNLLKLSAIVIGITASINVIAQKAPIKFGKIDIEDLKMEYYEKDSGAAAVVLCNYGKTYFTYNSTDFFQMRFDQIKRIKILKKEGYKYAEFDIPIYSKGSREEKVYDIKGISYNLVNGKIEKSKIRNSDIYTEKTSKYWKRVKFTLPDVKEGTIIEIKYSIISDYFFNLRDWYFQEEIPVKWSEYLVTIPEYYNYKILTKGYESFLISDRTTKPEKFTYQYKGTRPDMTGQGGSAGGTGSFDSNSEHFRLVCNEVNAFKNEPFLTTSENYISKVEFELASTQFPNSPIKNYSGTWESINKELNNFEEFGLRLNRDRFIEEKILQIQQSCDDKMNELTSIYNYVINNYKWNGKNGIYANDNLKKIFEQKSGNVAEINLLLTLMLRKAGFESNPVILSTRKNGIIHPGRPMLSAFNYVIVHVSFENQIFLLDATNKNCPFNMLPERCLNGKGRLISNNITNWVDLKAKGKNSSINMLELNLTESFEINGKLSMSSKEYAGINVRNKITNSTDIDDFVNEKKKRNPQLLINDFEITNKDSIHIPIKEVYEIEIIDQIETAGNLVYFNPIFISKMIENPFKLENREYPIDYACPYDKTYIMSMSLPENLTLEELPEPRKISLPDNAGYFIYSISLLNNKIQMTSKFVINKSLFIQTDYPALKEFYNQVVDMNNNQIILKKS